MIFLWIFLGLILLLLLLSFLIFFIASIPLASVPLKNPRQLERFIGKQRSKLALETCTWLKDLPCTMLTMESFDGAALKARWIPAEKARGTVMVLHGWYGSPESDFYHRLQLYWDLGFNLLLVHERGQLGSGGRCMTFGVKESRDAALWAEYHNAHLASCPVILSGISMGATTALMAMGEKLPDNVTGVIADCGFSSPWEILSVVVRRYHIPPHPFLDMARFWFILLAGYDPRHGSAQESMKKSRLPVLLIHGTGDRFVPYTMSKTIFDSYQGSKRIVLVPGAGHTMSYAADTEKCRSALIEFLRSISDQEKKEV